MTRAVAHGWWLVGATLVALVVAPTIPNAFAVGPSARVDPGQAKLGDTVVLSVEGFSANTLLDISLCGGNAAGGSTFCLIQRGFQTATDAAGVARAEVFVDRPPIDCPCVVRVVALTTGEVALAPLDIVGLSPQNPAPPPPMENPLELVVSAVEDKDSWAAFFGAGAQRLVKLAVRNRGDTPVVPIAITATAGPVGDPMTIVDTPPPPAIGPGETVAIEIPVDFPAFARGEQAIEGRIITEQGDLDFRVVTDVRWWTVWVVPAILLFEVILVVMWKLLRGSGRRHGDGGWEGGRNRGGDRGGAADVGEPAVPDEPTEVVESPELEPAPTGALSRESHGALTETSPVPQLAEARGAWAPPARVAAEGLQTIPQPITQPPTRQVPCAWPTPTLARWPAPQR